MPVFSWTWTSTYSNSATYFVYTWYQVQSISERFSLRLEGLKPDYCTGSSSIVALQLLMSIVD